jgi:hypothetical protein
MWQCVAVLFAHTLMQCLLLLQEGAIALRQMGEWLELSVDLDDEVPVGTDSNAPVTTTTTCLWARRREGDRIYLTPATAAAASAAASAAAPAVGSSAAAFSAAAFSAAAFSAETLVVIDDLPPADTAAGEASSAGSTDSSTAAAASDSSDSADSSSGDSSASSQLNPAFTCIDPPAPAGVDAEADGPPGAAQPDVELRGDAARLHTAVHATACAAAKAYARQALADLLVAWPKRAVVASSSVVAAGGGAKWGAAEAAVAEEGFNMQAFGGLQPFLRLVRQTHSAATAGQATATDKLALKVLEDKALEAVSDHDDVLALLLRVACGTAMMIKYTATLAQLLSKVSYTASG